MGGRALWRTLPVFDLLVKRSGAEVERVDGIVEPDMINTTINTDIEGGIPVWTESGVRLVFVGQLSELKHADELPNLLARLLPEYSLVIVGDGP